MYILLALGLVVLLVVASLTSALLIGQALLCSRLVKTEEKSAQPASVNLNRHTQPLAV